MDLRRQFTIIRAWFPLLVAGVLLAGGIAFVVSSLLPRSYEARATLIVGQSLTSANPDYSQLLVSQRLSATYAAVATKRPMLEAVITELGLPDMVDDLARRVRADAPLDSTLLTLTAEDPDPDRAAAIANALAGQLITASPAIQGRETRFQAFVDEELDATQAQIETAQTRLEALTALPDRTPDQDAALQALESRLAGLRSTYATLLSFASSASASLLTVIEPAVAPTGPVSPRTLLNTLLASLLGLFAAGAVVFLAEYLDDSVKDADDVQRITGLTTLGTIGRMNGDRGRSEIYRLAPLLYPRSGGAESYRTLRTNVEFASIDAPIRTLLVTSSVPGEGKTITACNLAIVFAQAGRRVLLVDADLRKPGVHVAFKLAESRGLTTLLRGDDVDIASLSHSTEEPALRVLTTGPLPPNPAELMGSQRMRAVIDQLRAQADVVVFDSPPLHAVSDSIILSSQVDATLLVIGASRGHEKAVRLAREALAKAGANVIGAVLNGTSNHSYAYYGPYYGEYRVAGERRTDSPGV